jgi:hypothetical protein
MKLKKWWQHTPKKFTKLGKLREIILWCFWKVRMLFTLNRSNKELKIGCCLGNLNYRKMKRCCNIE